MLIRSWMTKNPLVVMVTDTLAQVMTLMEQNSIRRVPVVDEANRLIGIITMKDALKVTPSALDASVEESSRVLAAQAQVEAFMTRHPITVAPDDPMEKAAALMLKNKITGIPVTDNGTLIGILSETDILRAFSEILGSEDEGIRVELGLDATSESLFNVMEILQDHDMTVNAINLCNDFSKSKWLLTLRLQGRDMERLLAALWDEGVQVNSVLPAP